MKALRLFIALLPLLTLLGCSERQTEPLDGKVSIRIEEGYTYCLASSIPRIELLMATQHWYPNSSYRLESDVTVICGAIHVSITGVSHGDGGFDAMTQAGSSTFLDLMPGTYDCCFRYGIFRDHYVVVVTDTSISLSGPDGSFTTPETRLYWRYPANSFACISEARWEDSLVCINFLDTLRSKTWLSEFRFPDSGTTPYPAFNAGNAYAGPATYFRCQNWDDFDKAGEVLKAYGRSLSASGRWFHIRLLDWTNRVYYFYPQGRG